MPNSDADKLEELIALHKQILGGNADAQKDANGVDRWWKYRIDSPYQTYYLAGFFASVENLTALKGLKRICLEALSQKLFFNAQPGTSGQPGELIAQWQKPVKFIDWAIEVLEGTSSEQAEQAIGAQPINWLGDQAALVRMFDDLEERGFVERSTKKYKRLEGHFLVKGKKFNTKSAGVVESRQEGPEVKKKREGLRSAIPEKQEPEE